MCAYKGKILHQLNFRDIITRVLPPPLMWDIMYNTVKRSRYYAVIVSSGKFNLSLLATRVLPPLMWDIYINIMGRFYANYMAGRKSSCYDCTQSQGGAIMPCHYVNRCTPHSRIMQHISDPWPYARKTFTLIVNVPGLPCTSEKGSGVLVLIWRYGIVIGAT